MSDAADDTDETRGDDGTEESVDDDPFAEFEDLDAADDPFAELEEAEAQFAEVEVEEIDEASIWEVLGPEQDDAPSTTGDGSSPDVDTDAEEHVVPKRSYCETCEHFATPPETACTHPGTEIRRLVDMEHFTVVNCPIVAQRRGIDEYDPVDSGDD